MANRATAVNLDFSNVKDQGAFNPKQVPAGDYLATITKVEQIDAKDDTPMWLFTFKLKKYSQNAYPYYCKLQENQLWKLRNLFVAAGINIPKKRVKVDPNKVVGKMVGVTMEDDEYEGRMKSVIAAVFPAAELADGAVIEDDEPEDAEEYEEEEEVEEEVEETEEEADEEEAEESGDEFDDMDRDALKKWLRKNSPGYSIKRSQSDDDLRNAAREIAAGSGDEEEEEDEAPAPKKAPAKKKPSTEVSDDELEELDIDDL